MVSEVMMAYKCQIPRAGNRRGRERRGDDVGEASRRSLRHGVGEVSSQRGSERVPRATDRRAQGPWPESILLKVSKLLICHLGEARAMMMKS